MTARSVRLLPQPDSPTIPSARARRDLERDAVDGAEPAALSRHRHRQVLDGECRRRTARCSSRSQHVGEAVAEQREPERR